MMLTLSAALQEQFRRDAQAQFPRECCGLIEGTRETDRIVATQFHHTKNVATGSDRFAIDPSEHIRIMRALRGSGRDLVGCYHSHPNGRAEPSQMDREGAGEEGFVWLIAGVGPKGTTLAAFLWRAGEFHSLSIEPT